MFTHLSNMSMMGSTATGEHVRSTYPTAPRERDRIPLQGCPETGYPHDEPWFVARDVMDVLGYSNGRKAIGDHCKG
ncbi:hypothetical protein G3N94_20750 [Burkholderia sp. Ac-20353]|nr:hypothetical protein [Burkholderia sp. Ac-20353]